MAERSSDNVETAKRYIGYWTSGVFDVFDDVDPNVELDWSESHAPYGGVYWGHQGWRTLWAELQTAFEEADLEVHAFVEDGPHVAIHNTSRLRGRDGVEVEATSTIVLTFEEGKIVKAKLFQEHADALEAIDAAG